MQSEIFGTLAPHLVSFVFGLSVFGCLYTIGASLCRIRHASSTIKHQWKLMYVAMLGLAGWTLCDLVTAEHTLFQQCVALAVAAYIRMVKDSWLNGPPPVVQPKKKAAISYAQARSQIKTGSLIGIQTGTLGGHIIQAGQVIAGLPFHHVTHCAVAVWLGQRLMAVEMNPGGNLFKPLSQYAGRRMVVCAPPPGTDPSRFDQALDHVTERHMPYSGFDLARIGLRLLPLRFVDTRRWGGDNDQDKVCSLLPAMLYNAMGGDVRGIPPLAAPADVVNALDVCFEVEG
jgi:hypothetical protein